MHTTRRGISRGFAAVVALVLSVTFGGGLAQADQLQHPINIRVANAKKEIAKAKIKKGLRKAVPASRADEVRKALEDAKYALEKTNRYFKNVPAKYHKHPEVVPLIKSIKAVKAYAADLEKQVKAFDAEKADADAKSAAAAKETKKLLGAFYDAHYLHGKAISLFLEPPDDSDIWLRVGIKQLKEARDAFRAIHKDCSGKYSALTAHKKYGPWCKAAAVGDARIKAVVEKKVRLYAKTIRDSYVKQSEKLAASGGTLIDWDENYYLDPAGRKAEIKKALKEDLALVGSGMPDDLFSKADAALAKLLGEIESQSKGWKYAPGGKKKSDAFVKKAYKAAFKGVKVKETRLLSKKWTVRKNSLGVPTHRFKRGHVLFQLRKEKWCRTHEFVYLQDYKGKKYGKTYFEHSPRSSRTNVVSCK